MSFDLADIIDDALRIDTSYQRAAYANTLARAAAAKLDDVPCILDWIPHSLHSGIFDGTGTTDLSTYINLALADVSDEATAVMGDTLYFPGGRYLIEDTIIHRSHVRIQGGGKMQTEFYLANNAKCDMLQLYDPAIEGWAIAECIFNGNKTNQGADDGTAAKDYRGLELIGDPVIGHAYTASRFDFGGGFGFSDPIPVMTNVAIVNCLGDGYYAVDLRELIAVNVHSRNHGRMSWYSKINDSHYVGLNIGPSFLGPNVIHDGTTNYIATKFWGTGTGDDSSGAMLDLWNNMGTQLNLGSAVSGYVSPSTGTWHSTGDAGACCKMKLTRGYFQGEVEDNDGSGMIIGTADLYLDLLVTRPGEAQDQYNLPFSTLSQNATPKPVTKYGVSIEDGRVQGRIQACSSTANTGKPTILVNIASSADAVDLHVTHDGTWTTPLSRSAYYGEVWMNGELQLPSRTATQIADKTDAINTQGKYIGRKIYDSTNTRTLQARATTDVGVWERTSPDDGGAAVTPS